MFDKRYTQRLKHRKQTGLYRNPPVVDGKDGPFIHVDSRPFINFASNDYLGLGSDPAVRKNVAINFCEKGPSASSSRLVAANFQIIRDAEKTFARFFGYEDALFFSSGFQANLALISTLFDTGDHIFFDKHIHASSVKGLTTSGAAFSGYRHNSLDHLEKRLVSAGDGPKAVLTEGLFSMDGDSPDFEALAQLKKKYGFLCVVDEAHSYGVFGPGGRGLAGNVADVGVGAMGKAFGLFGAFVLLPSLYREYMMNFAAPLIYSTSLPEAHARSAAYILSVIAQAGDKRAHLRDLSSMFRKEMVKEGFTVHGTAQILAVEIGDEMKTLAMAKALYDNGLYVFPARFPTVPMGRAILRISLTAAHQPEHIQRLVTSLISARDDECSRIGSVTL
jgi:8-amino-7-oxononanoate synthase